jgi:hypothetical protein
MSAEMLDFIATRFNRQELLTLCYEYFRDFYHDYSDTDLRLSALARELVTHCERHDNLARLHAALHDARPQKYTDEFGALSISPSIPKRRDVNRLFVSYVNRDARFAHRLANDLRERGYDIWIAPDSIQPGEKWVSAIDRGLGECGVFLIVMTPESVRSSWVRSETEYAIQAHQSGGGRLIPLLVRDCDVAELSNLISVLQYADFRENYKDGFARLVGTISLDQPRPRHAASVPPQREQTGQPKWWRALIGVGVGIILVAVLVNVGLQLRNSAVFATMPTATATELPAPTETPTPTLTPTATFTPLPTSTSTPPATLTQTPMPTDTATPIPSPTQTPTIRPTRRVITRTPIPPTPVPTTPVPPTAVPESAPNNSPSQPSQPEPPAQLPQPAPNPTATERPA